LHSVFSLQAKLVVNPGGICWVIAIAGKSAGSLVKISLIASVPPVEAPIKTRFLGENLHFIWLAE
jgi:hypothetical protein